MRSRKKIEKEHAKNKRVRKEKARLRNRKRKRKSRFVWITLNNLELNTIQKLRDMAKEKHISVERLTSKLLSRYIKEIRDELSV